MPKPRKQLISLDTTPYYHCTARCVRRAFLCGTDSVTGNCFEHRREWIEERIQTLSQVFSIDVCAYAVMSNHYHVVLHIDAATAEQWSDKEVCERWHNLYKGTLLTQKYLRGDNLSLIENDAVSEKLTLWRTQLTDISWFMRALNEPIARQANAEDNCTGKFWEARFTSQALLDEKALAACMVYVDLNPIRAVMAKTPETSEHTSIKLRISSLQKNGKQPKALMPFIGNPRKNMPVGLPFRLKDYVELVEWTGRIIREDKRGAIPSNLPSILNRINIDPQHWITLTTKFESRFKGLVGCVYSLKRAAQQLGFKRTPGLSACKILF